MFGISLSDLIREYGEEYIIAAYGLPLNANISSPVREDPDTNPSFRIYTGERGIVWKDFAMSTTEHDLKSLLIILENTNNEAQLAIKVAKQIQEKKPFLKKDYNHKLEARTAGVVFKRYWEDYEKKFWAQGDMDPNFLMSCNCFPVTQSFYNGMSYWKSSAKFPTYAYIFDQSANSFQCYRPYNEKGRKHFSWNVTNRLFGRKLITHKNHLVITSSYKDVMTLKKIGVQACCNTSETVLIKPHNLEILLNNFSTVYCMLNNDVKGRQAQKKYVEKGLLPINIPLNYPKDPWDIVIKFQSYNQLQTIINEQTSIFRS